MPVLWYSLTTQGSCCCSFLILKQKPFLPRVLESRGWLLTVKLPCPPWKTVMLHNNEGECVTILLWLGGLGFLAHLGVGMWSLFIVSQPGVLPPLLQQQREGKANLSRSRSFALLLTFLQCMWRAGSENELMINVFVCGDCTWQIIPVNRRICGSVG